MGTSVAGLVNLGNTCFISATLQALASCQALVRHLEDTLNFLAASGPAPAAAPAPAPALASALLDVLRWLQPQSGSVAPRSVAPRALLRALLSRLPHGVLEAGEEQDAAEAVELLCGLVEEELQAQLVRSVRHQLAAQASLTAIQAGPSGQAEAAVKVGAPTGSGGSCGLVDGGSAEAPNKASSNGSAPTPGGRRIPDGLHNGIQSSTLTDGCHKSSSSSGSEPAPGAQLTQPADARQPEAEAAARACGAGPPLPDPVLHAWRRRARLPLRGANAHELRCARCRHRSLVQLSPFWVLPLGISVRPSATLLGNVPAAPDASLQGSLAGYYGYEAVLGWHCTRCSLAASFQAADAATAAAAAAAAVAQHQQQQNDSEAEDGEQAAAAPEQPAGGAAPAGPLPAEMRRLKQVLADGGQLVESEAYAGMLAAAGIAFQPRPSVAAKRTVAAQLPRVLCLQLRRGFWSTAGHVKVTGKVAFPTRLQLPRSLVPMLGHDWVGAKASDGGEAAAAVPPLYHLRAVVVHVGGLAGGGHYTVYRCLDAAGDGGCGGGSWVSCSDEVVRAAELGEVLEAEASLLLYESCGGGALPPV